MVEFPVRKFVLIDEHVRDLAIAALRNAPLGIEVVMRPEEKSALARPTGICGQECWETSLERGGVEGERYSEEVWHFLLKKMWLPDQPIDGITLKGYCKWLEIPDGSLHLVGSTTKLTTKGFAKYLDDCMAFGAQELGIRFTVQS